MPEISPTGQAIDSEYKSAQKHFADVLESFIDQWPSMNQFIKEAEVNCHGLRWLHQSQSNITSKNPRESAVAALRSDQDKDLGPKFFKALAMHNQKVSEQGKRVAIFTQDGELPTAADLWSSCYDEGPYVVVPLKETDLQVIEMRKRIDQLQAQLEELSR